MSGKIFGSVCICCTVIAIVIFLVPATTALVFYHENTNKIEAFLPLETGDTFQFIFTHSIHLTDVVETYEVTDDLEIKQNEIAYEHFGIGMPSNAGEGEKFTYEDGKYRISKLDNIFSSINIRNGKTVSRNRLIWGNEGENLIWFNQYFDPGAWFKVKIKRITLWEYIRGVRIYEGR
ncbi:protein of unknown function [Gracilibacillus ureilyticus]|uniref:DUF1850 domain-containing protein n=1 Tax=Gracilibacillus ureilyticus TaxID=531814 RepID=A0A1H9Q5S1_9BACI|nr:DUF1850 domain-containing protein [Gracilibacillus ureilyticus]SER55787.1 protein of unknown function [Gracilibacillus ureilyticus]